MSEIVCLSPIDGRGASLSASVYEMPTRPKSFHLRKV